MAIKLVLSIEEINQLLSILGDQPIKSGLAALTAKIKEQGDEQLRSGGCSVAPDVTAETPPVV